MAKSEDLFNVTVNELAHNSECIRARLFDGVESELKNCSDFKCHIDSAVYDRASLN